MTSQRSTISSYRDIRGWFRPADRALFGAILEAQQDTPPGDLVEIGVFEGKSAVVIGEHLRPGERFVVVDPFGDPALLGMEDDPARGKKYFDNLSRQVFEQNYLALHDTLPTIVQALSDKVLDHVAPGTARFVHVDGSHEYEDVALDTRSARTMLREDGVVVYDDYRKQNAPGVAAAVWGSVERDGFIPVAITRQKLYGTYGDPAPLAAAVQRLVETQPRRWRLERYDVLGRTMFRVVPREAPPARGAKTAQTSSATRPGGSLPDRARSAATRVVRRLRDRAS